MYLCALPSYNPGQIVHCGGMSGLEFHLWKGKAIWILQRALRPRPGATRAMSSVASCDSRPGLYAFCGSAFFFSRLSLISLFLIPLLWRWKFENTGQSSAVPDTASVFCAPSKLQLHALILNMAKPYRKAQHNGQANPNLGHLWH